MRALAILFLLLCHTKAATADGGVPFPKFQTDYGVSCEELWPAMWQMFRDGDPNAAAYLAFNVFYVGLIPPGSLADVHSQKQHLYILTAYGAASDEPEARRFFEALRPAGERHYRCIVDGEQSPETCLADAVEAGYLPSIHSYEQEFETLENERNLPARCDTRLSFYPHIASPPEDVTPD